MMKSQKYLMREKESLKAEYTLADLRNSGASQREIEKQEAQVRIFSSDFTKARGAYNTVVNNARLAGNQSESSILSRDPC